MKKFLLITPVVALLAGCSLQQNTTINQEPLTQTGTEIVQAPTNNITAIDNNTNVYTNKTFGFSIIIPTKSDYFSGAYEISEEWNTIQIKNTTRFTVYNINAEDEIGGILKKELGQDCTRTKESTANANTFNIKAESKWLPLSPYAAWYSPSKKMLVVWNIWQDPKFMVNNEAWDSKVAASFKFLD